jgi:putative SOS response-associated peptidase YedK
MQGQAAKTKFGDFHFKGRVQGGFDEKAIFPLQPIAFGRLSASGEREFLHGQFGLVPEWVKDAKGGPKFGRYCYNARSESVFEKPSFKRAILQRRAVIPVACFYEFPDKETPLTHRYRIQRADKRAFWLAALWEQHPAYGLQSCSILTTQPMDLLAPVHSRSPVILDDEQLDDWLDPSRKQRNAVEGFLKPHGSEGFEMVGEQWGKRGV